MSEFRTVYVGNSVEFFIDFVSYSPSIDDDIPAPPVSVIVQVKKSDGTIIVSTVPTQISSYQFSYIYTPAIAGELDIIFTATYIDASTVVASQKLYVNSLTDLYEPTSTLFQDEVILFASEFDPIYLDPEELLTFFPESSTIEIAEIIYRVSQEVKEILGLADDDTGEDLSYIILDYIKAATACELSKTYSFGSDDEVSLKLADFSVTTASYSKTKLSRGTATSWCEIASVLRLELLSKKVSPKSFQPKSLPFYSNTSLSPYKTQTLIRSGPNYIEDPMPSRRFK